MYMYVHVCLTPLTSQNNAGTRGEGGTAFQSWFSLSTARNQGNWAVITKMVCMYAPFSGILGKLWQSFISQRGKS